MGTAGLHLKIVLESILTGALEADPATHAVQHSLNAGYTVGWSSTVETLQREDCNESWLWLQQQEDCNERIKLRRAFALLHF